MRNSPPLSPRVYSTPPRINTNPTREQRIVDIAYRLEDLSAELIDLVTNQAPDPNQLYPRTHRRQQSTARNRYEHQNEVQQNHSIRSRVESDSVSATAPSEASQLATTTTSDIKQESEVEYSAGPTRLTRAKAATNKKKSSSVIQKANKPTTKYSTNRGTNSRALHQVSASVARAIQPSSAEHFAEGEKVQLTKDNQFKGQVGTILKVTPTQLCIKFGKFNIYRKKTNVRKLDF